MIKVIQFWVLLNFAVQVPLCAQNTSQQDPFSINMTQFPYKTPEASAFMYNGKDEISEYTGNPNISIPLLTLTDRDISIPVTLTNKGDAIKVQEEASWVGLGWNLSVGGCINYVPAGSNDATSMYKYDWKAFEPYFVNQRSNVQKQSGTGVENMIYNNEALKGGLGEPDFYNVSVLGKNFTFFILPSSIGDHPQYVILGDDNEKFSIERFNDTNWVIKDSEGYSYYFEMPEYSQSDAYAYRSAWYLTSVSSPKFGHVSFHYSTHRVKMLPTYNYSSTSIDSLICNSATAVYDGPLPQFMNDSGSNIYFGNAYTQQAYLKSITSDNWILDFVTSKRTDMEDDPQKLDDIKLTSKIDNKEKRRIHFNYSYFNGVGHDNKEYNTSPCVKIRLKLNSVDDGFDASDMETYRFAYDKRHALPWKRSSLEDYWGYYNAPYIPLLYNDMSTARRVSPDYITTGMLTRIYYPTGGSTEYTFEPHEFDSDQFRLYTKKDSIHVGISESHNVNEKISQFLSLNDDYSGSLQFYFSGSNGKLDDLYNKGACIRILNMNGGSFTLEKEIRIDSLYLSSSTAGGIVNRSVYTGAMPFGLSKGLYVVIAVLPKDVSGCVRCLMDLKSFNVTPYSVGGGVRVKTITNYDEENKSLFHVDYSYTQGTNVSSGKLLYPMCFLTHEVYVPYQNQIKTEGILFTFWKVYRIARINWNGNVSTAFSNNWLGGKTIGYSSVTKKEYDADGRQIRTISSGFSNDVRYDSIDNTYDLKYIDIGKLLTQAIVDNSGHLYKTIQNAYTINPGGEYMVAAKCHENWIGPSTTYGQLPVYPECDVITYKYFNQWQVLSSTVEKTYGINNQLASTTTTNYDYNSTNKCLGSTTVTDNSGYVKTNNLYYDTSSPNYFAWSVPIKQQMSYNGSDHYLPAMKTIETEYGLSGNAFVPFSHRLYHADSNLQEWINYKYDYSGNVIEEAKDSLDRAVYLWGYDNEYPVAKITGATYNEVQSWATSSLINTIAENKGTGMPALLADLRSRLKPYNAQLTTYTYIPLVGIQTMQTPNGEIRTFAYDSHGRLIEASDNQGNIVDKYSYHFNNN